jgi:hypothetical protein
MRHRRSGDLPGAASRCRWSWHQISASEPFLQLPDPGIGGQAGLALGVAFRLGGVGPARSSARVAMGRPVAGL